jgi:hypothetical protein
MKPHLLKVNIISSRISNYLIFPLVILAGFAIVWTFDILREKNSQKSYLPSYLIFTFFTLIFLFITTNGMYDNAASLKNIPNIKTSVQTFNVADRLNSVLKKDSWLVKDHNYVDADAWIKIFFARDYSFPLSRAYFQRYENNPYRETCTLLMISQPNTAEAIECFEELNVDTILVHTDHDAAQFASSDNFSKIYENDEVSVFLRK